VTLSSGPEHDHLHPAQQEDIGDLHGYLFENGVLAQYEITNRSDQQAHIYFLTVGPDGRLHMGPLLRDQNLVVGGVSPNDTATGTAFKVKGAGLKETRFLWSADLVLELLSLPTVATGAANNLDVDRIASMRMKRVWYLVREDTGM
jgi:hypothetical protein